MAGLSAHHLQVMPGSGNPEIWESGSDDQVTVARQQAAVELARGKLAQGALLRLRVSGQSMAPLVERGDLVLVQRVNPADLRRGDLVLVEQGGGFLVHRLVAAPRRRGARSCGPDAHQVQTKGDNASYADLPLLPQDVLGRVVAVERDGRRIELGRGWWPMVNRLLGLLGWGEVQLFTAGRIAKRRLVGAQGGRWTMSLTSPAATPFRWLTRLLIETRIHR
jgi:signal peptidase I